ncbi:chaperonin 10-like protein [Thelonectria olida]|uniref:Chaperonin 10-like protein n=1 Tax=Thelonectria olida TaxID=1576542 RepID=A0A9P8W9Z2_9HYPO|nr:chaperonin 10-like protein [Thelonectria olida]
MATQSGIVIKGVNEPYTIVDDLPRRTPSAKQALVKSLAVGINPVEPMQQHMGLLVNEWPAVLGSDCVGLVTEVGADCKKLKKGDYVFGCAPLGQNKYTPLQETFLVEEDVFFKKPPNLSLEEAATVGVGLLTSALSLISGLELSLPEAGTKVQEKDEWVVILGGSGSVGQFAVQIAKACGYKVAGSCSPSKDSIATRNGATKTFNSRGSPDEQLANIKEITGGNFGRIFDSTAHCYEVMVQALGTVSKADAKFLASVDDWSEFKTPAGIKEYRVELGFLCRPHEPLGVEVTRDIAKMIPTLEGLLEAGALKPIQYVSDGVGWDKVIEGIHKLEGGKESKKIVVRVQEE